MVDVGRLQTTVVVARFGEGGDGSDDPVANADSQQKKNAAAPCPYSVLAVRSNVDLGAFHFDDRMFLHFQGLVSGDTLCSCPCEFGCFDETAWSTQPAGPVALLVCCGVATTCRPGKRRPFVLSKVVCCCWIVRAMC